MMKRQLRHTQHPTENKFILRVTQSSWEKEEIYILFILSKFKVDISQPHNISPSSQLKTNKHLEFFWFSSLPSCSPVKTLIFKLNEV